MDAECPKAAIEDQYIQLYSLQEKNKTKTDNQKTSIKKPSEQKSTKVILKNVDNGKKFYLLRGPPSAMAVTDYWAQENHQEEENE